MPKNYSDSFYLEGTDVAELIQGYYQAYTEKYPEHALVKRAKINDSLGNHFWQNDKGEVIFYAGEQTLIDRQNEAVTQQVGRGFYDATLSMTARFLELDTPILPSENMHVISLINFDRGHWTSAILSIKNINEEKYQEIYALYQDFKQFLKTTHPEFVMERGEQSCTNLFVQYATGNRHGSVVGINNKADTEKYICEFFTSIGKQDLLEIKGLSKKDRYVEGDLKLVLEPNKETGNIGVYHFDSMLSEASNKRLEQGCTRFLKANNTKLLWAKNIPMQTGATCGEHSILNAFKYVFFGLTNAISSSDLRKGTNHFCPEIAKLFLFEYDSKTFKEEYARILDKQKLKEAKKEVAPERAPDVLTGESIQTKKLEASDFLEYGIYIGIGVALICLQVIAPKFLGLVDPILAGIFSMAVGVGVAQRAKIFASDVEEAIQDIKTGNIFAQKNDISDEQKLLEKLSNKSFKKEYSDKNTQIKPNDVLDLNVPLDATPKTFTPMLAAVTTVTPVLETTLPLANTTEVNPTKVTESIRL